MTNCVNIGKKIKEIRKKEGLSQEEFAFRINVSRQTVYFWENGKVIPDTSKLLLICKEFNIDINKLICINDENIESKQESYDLHTIEVENKSKQIKTKKKFWHNKWNIAIIIIAIVMVIIAIILTIYSFSQQNVGNLENINSSQWNLSDNLKVILSIFAILVFSIIANFIIWFFKKIRQKKKVKNETNKFIKKY